MSIDEINYIKRFELRNLGPEHFDHNGHLYMAWVHLSHFEFDEANRRVCEGIEALANKFKAPEKYNRTLTEALMRIIAQRMQKQASMGFEQFLAQNTDLVNNAEDVMARHYSLACLNSPFAKKQWVEPDLTPFNNIPLSI